MMNRMSIIVMAGAAELAAHFLSLSWGFGVIVIAFLWVAGTLRASMATAAAKSATNETRINGLVSAVGTVNGNLGNYLPLAGGTITGSLTVNSNLGVHGGTTLTGASSCSSDWTVGGNFSANNTSTVFGSEGVHGNFTAIGTINGATIPWSAPSGAPAPPTGTGGAAQYAGNFYTGSGAAVWAQGISNKVDNVITTLINAGLFH